jgi:hypothetical protein
METAWEQHGICESALRDRPSVKVSAPWIYLHTAWVVKAQYNYTQTSAVTIMVLI